MKRVCVFAGSNVGASPEFELKTIQLGEALVKHGLELVYGGSKIGLMGRIAETVLAAGGKAIGVMPRNLFIGEMVHTGLTELHEVENMHERKALMSELADAYIALPGGLGTFEEVFEAISWSQLGIHRKPIGILNVGKYYEPMAEMLQTAVDAGFMQQTNLGLMIFEEKPDELIRKILEFTPPAQAHKWNELN